MTRRMLRDLLRQRGFEVGRLHVGSLMKKMGIEAIYRRPNTSKPAPGHRIYPYLLRGLAITRPNQAWAMDISYIPMARGFVYLAAVVDWFSRRILSWRLSIAMDVSFCLEAVDEALAKHGSPEIFNTDQGSQFSSEAFTGRLKQKQHRHQHGRQGQLARQCLHRAYLEVDQVRGGLPPRISVGAGGEDLSAAVHRVLQRSPAPLPPERKYSRSGLLPTPARNPGGLNRKELPPKNQQVLFRQTEPPLSFDS